MSSRPLVADAFPAVPEEDWRALVAKSLGDLASLTARSDDGLPVGPIYPQTAPGAVVAHRGRWAIVQRVDAAEPVEAKSAIADDLGTGADGVHIVGPASACAYGAGIASDAVVAALAGVNLEGKSVRIDAGEDSLAITRAMLPRARAEAFTLFAAFDPLATLAARSRLGLAVEEAFDAAAGLALALDEANVAGAALVADGRPWSDGGASEAEELAAVAAAFVGYLRAFATRGHGPERGAHRIDVVLAADADQFVTTAKFRAAHLMIGRILESTGVDRSTFRVHAQTAWRIMTRHDPQTNILRATIAAFAAATAGADSIMVLPFDGVDKRPSALARRLARNTQLLLRDEANLDRVADPGAGAGAIEALTDALAEAAWERFRAIEMEGGLLAAIRSGSIQRVIAETRHARLAAVSTRRRLVTGTSAFPNLGEPALPAALPATPRGGTGELVQALVAIRISEPFERVRARADALAAASPRPAVRLDVLGKAGALAADVVNILAAGGLTSTREASVAACICAPADAADGAISERAAALRADGARWVLLAGRAGDGLAGVDATLADGADTAEILARTLDHFENVASVQ